jgi:hypothetical protein
MITHRISTKTPYSLRCRLAPAFILFLLAPLAPAFASITAEATVQHPSMSLGQTNSYTITLRNVTHIPQLEPPSVPGMAFSRTHSSHSSQSIINGRRSMETTLSWPFQAEREGHFVIPEREIEILGQRLRISAVTVEVTAMSAELRNRFFLRWSVPPAPFYVGQAIPATLQLFVRSGVNASLGSHPDGSADQFIRSPFSSEARQRQELVNGQPYVVVEWDTVITPIRAGRGDLPVNLILVYETGQMRRDFFGPQAVREQIRLTTDPGSWEIRDLPRANRPASFSGAVGSFEVQSRLSAREAETGDPLTLVLEVRGEGNFERIQAPQIPETAGWRIYPPRTQMQEEQVPYRGVRTFEYILSPTDESVEEVPAFAFSWFDPEQAVWQERVIGPEPVRIRPGTHPSRREPFRADASSVEPQAVRGLQPMAKAPGRSRSLTPVWRQPVFWVFNGGMGLLTALALIGVTRQKKAALHSYLQVRSESTRKGRELASQALKSAARQDGAAFYLQATQSLRHFLAYLDPQSHKPESLTWHELEVILRRFSFPETSQAQTRMLFDRQDAVHFAGWKPPPEELRKDSETFETLLDEIATRKP